MKIFIESSIANVRSEPSNKSELVAQLLFADTAILLNEFNEWGYISNEKYKIQGWISKKNYSPFIASNPENNNQINNKIVFYDLISFIYDENKNKFPVFCGTIINDYKKINENFYNINGKIFFIEDINKMKKISSLKELALSFLNSPYLWGGNTFAGIDCSGLPFIVFKCLGINLYRNSYHQVELGEEVFFIENAKVGDLLFFGNEEKIYHVGIYLGNNQVLHSSGYVKIDYIDNYGIFDTKEKKYTHNLLRIKRILKNNL